MGRPGLLYSEKYLIYSKNLASSFSKRKKKISSVPYLLWFVWLPAMMKCPYHHQSKLCSNSGRSLLFSQAGMSWD